MEDKRVKVSIPAAPSAQANAYFKAEKTRPGTSDKPIDKPDKANKNKAKRKDGTRKSPPPLFRQGTQENRGRRGRMTG
jgi:hypothetical protein